MTPLPKAIEWRGLEHSHSERSHDWFWAIGILAVGIAILSIYFGNMLLALVILLSAFASILHAHTEPKSVTFKIGRRGIQVGTTLYPYSSLDSFWVIDEEVNDRILFRSRKVFMPYLIVPFDSTKTDPEQIRDFLLDYLDEEELEEPLSQKILEFFGF